MQVTRFGEVVVFADHENDFADEAAARRAIERAIAPARERFANQPAMLAKLMDGWYPQLPPVASPVAHEPDEEPAPALRRRGSR